MTRLTRRGRLTISLCLVATACCLGFVPMYAQPTFALSVWALALIGAVLVADLYDRADHARHRHHVVSRRYWP